MNKDQQAIKQSLTNFVGAIVDSSERQDIEARHEAAATLLEEVLKLSEEQGGSRELYVLKPLFRATINVLLERKKELSELQMSGAQDAVKEIDKIVEYLKKLAE